MEFWRWVVGSTALPVWPLEQVRAAFGVRYAFETP